MKTETASEEKKSEKPSKSRAPRKKKLYSVIERDNSEMTLKVVLIKYGEDRRPVRGEFDEILKENAHRNCSYLLLEGEEEWKSLYNKGG